MILLRSRVVAQGPTNGIVSRPFASMAREQSFLTDVADADTKIIVILEFEKVARYRSSSSFY